MQLKHKELQTNVYLHNLPLDPFHPSFHVFINIFKPSEQTDTKCILIIILSQYFDRQFY